MLIAREYADILFLKMEITLSIWEGGVDALTVVAIMEGDFDPELTMTVRMGIGGVVEKNTVQHVIEDVVP